MRFKQWMEDGNYLAGPGGGPENAPEDLENLAKQDAKLGVGAFPTTKKERIKKSVAAKYADKRIFTNFMKK